MAEWQGCACHSACVFNPSILLTPTMNRLKLFHLELGFFGLLLLACNIPVLNGHCNSALLYNPVAVRAGEWWRILTFPFVHVTWYHLLLDGSAFFLLYKELAEFPFWKRWASVVASGAGSLLVSVWTDPALEVKGLCGISGIAHGLMLISALELMSEKGDRTLYRMGLVCFVTVIAKSTFEAFTGHMLFTFLDFGMVGDPVAVTHAGGALGGLICWLLTSNPPWSVRWPSCRALARAEA
jgi:rhomboid family GlyGly-CTERM serine protease